MSMKNSNDIIETATFRFVAQCLNQLSYQPWLVRLYRIFPHYLISDKILGGGGISGGGEMFFDFNNFYVERPSF